MKPKRNIYRDAIELFEHDWGNAAVARRLGVDRQMVCNYRWRWQNPERFKAIWRASYCRRREGRPREEYLAEMKARADKRVAKIKPFLAMGMSWGQAAAKLGISRNTIAGLMSRQRYRKEAA